MWSSGPGNLRRTILLQIPHIANVSWNCFWRAPCLPMRFEIVTESPADSESFGGRFDDDPVSRTGTNPFPLERVPRKLRLRFLGAAAGTPRRIIVCQHASHRRGQPLLTGVVVRAIRVLSNCTGFHGSHDVILNGGVMVWLLFGCGGGITCRFPTTNTC